MSTNLGRHYYQSIGTCISVIRGIVILLTLLILLLPALVGSFPVPVRVEFDAEIEENILDMTYPFNNQTVYYPSMEQLGFTFQLGTVFRGLNKQGNFYSAYWFQAAEHGGTHLDAPSHNQANGSSIDKLPLSQIIGPACVLDISQKARRNVNYEVTVEDLQQWEESHGKLPKGCILLICTGWGRKWPNRNALFGTKNFPDDTDFHFPGFGQPAAKWLIKHRSTIKAIGTDTPSIDSGLNQRQLPVHQLFSLANIPIIEFVANMDKLPPIGARLIGLPVKIQGASAAPLRLIAVNWRTNGDNIAEEEDNNNVEEDRTTTDIMTSSTGGGNRKKNSTSSSSLTRPTAGTSGTTGGGRKSKDSQTNLKITSSSSSSSPASFNGNSKCGLCLSVLFITCLIYSHHYYLFTCY